MSSRGEQRHVKLVRYFRGDFDQIYKKTVLKGPQGVKVEPVSYMALYAAGDLSYVRVLPAVAIQRRAAMQQVLTLAFPAPPRKVVRSGRCSNVNPDELNWAFATEETEELDLPAIFVAWTRAVYGGHEQVALWYPEMVSGDWALERFQQGVRTCLARG